MSKLSHRRRVAGAVASVLLVMGTASVATADEPDPADQPYRPLVHFTPEMNWMNDPNGMVYVDGVYHLFFQHNPESPAWGNLSWGHATSEDLLTWTEQPVAITPGYDSDGNLIEHIFSGSVVVDEHNSSGFGTADNPPLVAIYTSAYTHEHPEYPDLQAQSLAYSLDNGQTWTKYENNPVINRDSAHFRDPKVFWYDDGDSGYWVMVAVESEDEKVVLYKSTDLKDWSELSEFENPSEVHAGWECPDLFELPVEGGEPGETKWVMVISHGNSIAGGSGMQYFVGDFNGTKFVAEDIVDPSTAPEGVVFEDFENGYGGWTVANDPTNEAGITDPFGTEPKLGSESDFINGYVDDHLAESLTRGWNQRTGSLTSPSFTIEDPYINFKIAGGNNPHVDAEPAEAKVVYDFESDLDDSWPGDLGRTVATPETAPEDLGAIGDGWYNTAVSGPDGNGNQGWIASPTFEVTGENISFLLGGGDPANENAEVRLLHGGETVKTARGSGAPELTWENWDVSDLVGEWVQFQIIDNSPDTYLAVDQVTMSDSGATSSEETTVNLIVDGEVVRTATGNNSQNLDWISWNVDDLEGKEATIKIVDNNTEDDWGHIMADHFMFADEPALPVAEQYNWLDWGRDYYAAVTYSGAPVEDSVIMQGWMSNWQYADPEILPTEAWTGSMSLPREVTLVQTSAGPQLQQKVVDQADGILDTANAASVTELALSSGSQTQEVSGDVVKLDLTLDPGTAKRAGITVFQSEDGTGTKIGYDSEAGRVYVDRTNSGNSDFSPLFPSVDDAAVVLDEDGNLTLEIYLDRASVELFANDGLRTITDQVFPEEGADGISAWAESGDAEIVNLTVTPLNQTMFLGADPGTDPTEEPTEEPSEEPTEEPTGEPTDDATGNPTQQPTEGATDGPTDGATGEPTGGATGSADHNGFLPNTGFGGGALAVLALALLGGGVLAVRRSAANRG